MVFLTRAAAFTRFAKMLKTKFRPDLVVMYPERAVTPVKVPVLAWIDPLTSEAESRFLRVPSVPLTASVFKNK